MSIQVNPNGRVMNCQGCGKDTKAKSGYCSGCSRGSYSGSEARGRPAQSMQVIAGTPILDSDAEGFDTDREYQGGSPRDDI